ncbi:TolC family protein [Polaribacter sp.]|nr:TolC family protein [Polaribacter sp.]MDA9362810.1 TolC family protein [Polaribacter sp.]MDB4010054.1 TolC family protein [Polaribacter sp.]MDB4182667.1 TolC family protein [Polaribacter sp.]MDB9770593.1 TolC family protein [Polaribacter sp.]
MKTKLILTVAIFTSLASFSQKKWTLKECVDQALERNISVQQSKLNLKLAEKDVAIANGNFLPNLNGGSSGNFNSGLSPDRNGVLTNTNNFNGSFSLRSSGTIFNGYRNTNTYKQAQLGVASSKYDLQKIENDISLFVVNGYLNVLFAKENLNVANVQYEISAKQIEAVKSRFEAGVVAKGEVLNIQSTAAANLQSVIAQENVLNLALLNLAQTIQVPIDNFDVAPIELGTPSENLLYTNSDIVFEKSLLNRPEIESAKLAIESADLSIEIAKSAYKPTLTYSLSAGTSYYHQFNNLLPTRFNDDFISQTADRFQYGIGFNVSVPIFNRYQTKNNVAKSEINKEIFITRLESEKIQLKQTIEQAFLDVKAAAKSYQAAKISLAAQEEAFKNSQQRYNFGDMTLFDFDQVRTRLVNAKGVMIRSKFDYVFKTKILEFYSGELVLE